MDFDKDLDVIMGDWPGLTIIDGQAKGRVIDGMFDTNHLQKSLAGVRLDTKSPFFTCATSRVSGIRKGTKARYEDRVLTIKRVMKDPTGMARIEFEEDLDGNIEHGDLD